MSTPEAGAAVGRQHWAEFREAHTAAMLDQVWAMARDGATVEEAADKMLCTSRRLYEWCQRHDPELYERLRANERNDRLDYLWDLARAGISIHGATDRLVITRSALYHWCRRHSPEVWAALRDNTQITTGRPYRW